MVFLYFIIKLFSQIMSLDPKNNGNNLKTSTYGKTLVRIRNLNIPKHN